MNERASVPVGFPVPNPTISYWQDPPDEIAGYQSSSSLPQEVDTVIIGSGITGASIAYNLLTSDFYNGEKILMLEAREACSGATGRNGIYALSFFCSLLGLIGENYRWTYKSSLLPLLSIKCGNSRTGNCRENSEIRIQQYYLPASFRTGEEYGMRSVYRRYG